MSRMSDNEDGMPWEMWNNVMSRVLIGKKAQAALAELEEALLELPDKRIISNHLAAEGSVCAVGLYIAKKRAESARIDLSDQIALMQENWEASESDYETVSEGVEVGLDSNLAWHLAFLNDEEWSGFTPEERYEKLLSFVRNALGREQVAA